MDEDALGFCDRSVHSAHFADIDITFVVDEIDGHRDFVCMGREHEARRTAFVQHSDAIAVGIGKGLFGERFHVIQPDALAAGLVANRTGGVDEGF